MSLQREYIDIDSPATNREQNYFHRSSIATGSKLPSVISSSPWRTISSNDGVYPAMHFCAACLISNEFLKRAKAFSYVTFLSSISTNQRCKDKYKS